MLAGCPDGLQYTDDPARRAEGEAAEPPRVARAPGPTRVESDPKEARQDRRAWQEGRLAAQLGDVDREPRDGGEVRVQIAVEPPSLDLLGRPDWFAQRILADHVYESLVRRDPYDHPAYRIVPSLAERWKESREGLGHTFHLRRGVRWHDGEAFTAEDVVATFERLRRKRRGSEHYHPYLDDLAAVHAVDDHTVRFRWKRPYFMALEALAMVPIQPSHLIGGQPDDKPDLSKHPVGTGPFEFEAWDKGRSMTFRRSPSYWGPLPHLERVRFIFVGDPAMALQMARSEELDVVERIPPDRWKEMHDPVFRASFHRSKFFGNNYAFIGWNQRRPFFANAKVRRALTMLTARDELLREAFLGLYRATDCAFHYASEICDFEHEPLPHDPERAKALLEEAGWKDRDGDGVREKEGRRFAFRLTFPFVSGDARSVAAHVQEKFTAAGIVAEAHPLPWKDLRSRLHRRDFDAVILMWRTPGVSIDPAQMWHSGSTAAGSNYVGFRSQRVDRLIEQASAELDRSRRTDKYTQVMQILWKEQPYTFLYVQPNLALLHERVQGVRESLMGWQYRDWWIGP